MRTLASSACEKKKTKTAARVFVLRQAMEPQQQQQQQAMEQESGVECKPDEPNTSVWSYHHALRHMPNGPRIRKFFAELFLSLPVFTAVITWLIIVTFHGLSNIPRQPTESPDQRELRPKSFYDGEGAIGYDHEVVPNIIHLIRYNQPNLTFLDVIFIRSMYLNHRPAAIMVHCSPCGFTGPFVNWTEGINFTFNHYLFPTQVFGMKIQGSTHIADIARMHILNRYGGIYLDWDVFVVQSLRRFLRYEGALPCPPGAMMTNNIMFFHKNSRFLKLYIELHRGYNESRQAYYTAELPTKLLAHKRPHLLNCMNYGLEAGLDMLGVTFEPHGFPNWRSAFAVHSYIHFRWESPYDPLKKDELTQSNIRNLDNAMGQMARSVLFGTSNFVEPDAPVLSVAELAARKDRGEDLTKWDPKNTKPFYAK